jgi:hypothetical protein
MVLPLGTHTYENHSLLSGTLAVPSILSRAVVVLRPKLMTQLDEHIIL